MEVTIHFLKNQQPSVQTHLIQFLSKYASQLFSHVYKSIHPIYTIDDANRTSKIEITGYRGGAIETNLLI